MVQNQNNTKEVILSNCIFAKLREFSEILRFERVRGTILLDSNIFDQNEVLFHVLNAKDSLNFTLINSVFTFTNNKPGNLFREGGGAVRLYNIFYKNILNVEISYGFSVNTCFGIKFLDDSNRNLPMRGDTLCIFFNSYYPFLFLNKIWIESTNSSITFYIMMRVNEGAGAIYLDSADDFL